MTAQPETMRAVKVRFPNEVFVDDTAPFPTIRPGYLLVKVLSVALNPTDWKGAAFFKGEEPHTLGCDAVGRVIVCGDQSNKVFKCGDRVAGLCYGIKPGDPASGAYGEYALLKAALSLPVPDHVSDAEAATIPVGINTIALYQTLELPTPSYGEAPLAGPTVLIYGGGTATGMFALQFARLSGCRVLTTCSPRNNQLVKALGAHQVFDYHDTEACAAAIRTATENELLYAFDCIAEGASLQICANALTSRSNIAVYTGTLPVAGKFPRQDVKHGWTSGYTGEYLVTKTVQKDSILTIAAFGEVYHFLGKPQPARPDDLAFSTKFWDLATTILQQDRLRLGCLVQEREGGLEGILDGLSDLKGGRLKAGKLVYRLL
ncbi:GroES-like protein, partial [Aureobasidium melanogenum]